MQIIKRMEFRSGRIRLPVPTTEKDDSLNYLTGWCSYLFGSRVDSDRIGEVESFGQQRVEGEKIVFHTPIVHP